MTLSTFFTRRHEGVPGKHSGQTGNRARRSPALMLRLMTGCLFILAGCGRPSHDYDICIYGGTSAGVIAAYTAKMMGKSVLLIEPGHRLGGLTSGGLGYTDIGNKYAVTGLSRDFYRRVGEHYGKFEQWIFEPHVAESLFVDYMKRSEAEVLYGHRIVSATKDSGVITEIRLENTGSGRPGRTVSAKMFIDCSYEGDLMASAGVSYTTGREANSVYGETYNGVQLMEGHQFPDGVDPYRIPGDSSSGLLWGISSGSLAPEGSGDKKIQAYNFRICLTNDPDNMIPVTRPENYDSTRYDLLLRLIEAQPGKRSLNNYFIWSRMPNNKTDINNRGAFSTDMIGMNYDYPEGSYEERAAIVKRHENYTKGLLYFYGHDPRVPDELRAEMLQWGYPKDEYPRNGHFSPQLYVREVRRMLGSYVMTQANCVGEEVVSDGVGMAAYTMDSHNCQRIVVEKNGKRMVKNEGNVEIGGFGPYPVSYRSLVPKAEECRNLLVPVCLSASHIAYGSIRMEPVFMVLAQSSAVAASIAIDAQQSVQGVDVAKIREILENDPLADGSTPEIMIDNRDTTGVTITGSWEVVEGGSYGPDRLQIAGAPGTSGKSLAPGAPGISEKSVVPGATDGSADHGTPSVRFSADIAESGEYAVYTYFPRLKNNSAETHIRFFDGQEVRKTVIEKEDVIVEGQTSGEWVLLGSGSFEKGEKAYVEVLGENAGGAIVADAVLWIPAR